MLGEFHGDRLSRVPHTARFPLEYQPVNRRVLSSSTTRETFGNELLGILPTLIVEKISDYESLFLR